MKLAIFHNLPSGGAKRGLHGFTRELALRGHQLSEIRLSTADSAFLPLAPFVTAAQVIQFDPRNHFPKRIPILGSYLDAITAAHTLHRLNRVSREMANQIDAQDYDAVFAHDCVIALNPPILKYLTVPTTFYCHHARRGQYYASPSSEADSQQNGLITFTSIRTRVYQFAWKIYWAYFSALETASIRSANHRITNSTFSSKMLYQDFKVSSEVIHYGIDSVAFSPANVDEGNFVLAVGALTPQKGYRFLVRAIAAVPPEARPPLIILSNVKNTAEEQALRVLAAQLSVELNVQSALDQATLLRYYREAKVFVYTPFMEAYGLAPLEAMACGKPVVAIQEGGVRESVIHGTTGYLVERNENTFAEALCRLLNNAQLRRSMGDAGRQQVLQEWSWTKSGDKLDAALQNIANRSMDG